MSEEKVMLDNPPAEIIIPETTAVNISEELFPDENTIDVEAVIMESEAIVDEVISISAVQEKPPVEEKKAPTRPKLSKEEALSLMERKQRREIAAQQWSGLAAIRDKIQFAPEKKSGFKGKPKFHSKKK